jgi:SAM-dependent methyltransferase
MTASAQPDLDRQAGFWDARAADYPDPRWPEQHRRLLQRIGRLPREARPGPGLRLLDVGAGAGSLALHAAEQGSIVTALDVSAGMLRRLEAAAGQQPIRTLVADWRGFDVDRAGFRRAFDLVYAQMVPSFREAADFARLEACSRGWCVFIGWGRERHDPWLEAAFLAHGVPWEVPTGVPLAVELLAALGRDPHPVYWPETWKRSRSVDAALRDARDHLHARGADASPELLRALMEKMSDGDRIVDACQVEIGLLAWHVDPRDGCADRARPGAFRQPAGAGRTDALPGSPGTARTNDLPCQAGICGAARAGTAGSSQPRPTFRPSRVDEKALAWPRRGASSDSGACQ